MEDIRFGFFWYNDDEIFRFSEDDFNNKAENFAEAGINVVITFSCTHFRWTMYPFWNVINECLAKIVKACHKYGIKVVEHHSSHLTFDPLNSEEWDFMERVLNKRHSSIASWKGIRDYLSSDTIIAGKPISSFRQVDGRNGKWARTCYHGYGMCFNNPDYKKAYFSYLEEVYKTGIDGIMADDVQLFGDGNACACEHCRRLFAETTGYELPQPGEKWHEFYGDYDNPVYIAWEKFRRQSTTDFQFNINRHFKSIGLELMRPNYVSNALMGNPTAYPLDSAALIWDYVFQENCYSSIIKYSWPSFAMEAVHRYALGERNKKPSMSHFYPDRKDTYYFAWALAKSWGQLFLATPEGHDSCEYEKVYREFEINHFGLLFSCKKQADIAFYFSLKTRDYIKDATEKNMKLLYSWMQSSYALNLSIDMAFENDNAEKLMQFPAIILPCISMMNENEFTNLRRYVENGGTLLLLGLPGERDENGIKRPIEALPQKFGICGTISSLNDKGEEYCTAIINGKEAAAGMVKTVYRFDGVQGSSVIMETCNGDVIGICTELGKGKLIWLVNSFGYEKHHSDVRADRWYTQEIRTQAPEYVFEKLKKIPGEIIESLVCDRLVKVIEGPENMMVSCFAKNYEKGFAIHIVNTDGTLAKDASSVGHSDLITSFSGEPIDSFKDTLKISLRINDGDSVKSIMLYTPERDSEYELDYCIESNRLIFSIPQNIFNGYAVVSIVIQN